MTISNVWGLFGRFLHNLNLLAVTGKGILFVIIDRNRTRLVRLF
jgi:hypothetical protein